MYIRYIYIIVININICSESVYWMYDIYEAEAEAWAGAGAVTGPGAF